MIAEKIMTGCFVACMVMATVLLAVYCGAVGLAAWAAFH